VAAAAIATWLVVAVHPSGRSRGRAALVLTAPTLLGLGTWFLYGHLRGVFELYGEYGPLARADWSRLPFIVGRLLLNLWTTAFALPYVLPVIAFAIAGRKSRATAVPLIAAGVLTGFLIYIFLHSEANPQEWIDWATARVLSPLPALFVLGAAIVAPRGDSAVRPAAAASGGA